MSWEWSFWFSFPHSHLQKPFGHNWTRVGHTGEMLAVEIYCFGSGGQYWPVSSGHKILNIFILETMDPGGNRHNLKLFESAAIPGHQEPPGE